MIPNKLVSTSWKENRVTYRPLDKLVAKQTRKAENVRLDTVCPQRFCGQRHSALFTQLKKHEEMCLRKEMLP